MLNMVDRKAEELKKRIIEADSSCYAAGTIYYVSNGGCDSADGRTPETAWKTLDKVNGYTYQSGDAVLFERGGEWRGQLNAHGGVSYSAYGQGDKPIITGSLKNYAVASEWKATDYENIYVCDEAISNDVGVVVFDHGAAWSFKMVVGTR